jgi:hypothetical protein
MSIMLLTCGRGTLIGAYRAMIRRADMIGISLFLCLLAFIGISFLASGIELYNNAVSTTATVVRVRNVHEGGASPHHKFTLEFTDQYGEQWTEETEDVRQTPVVPKPGNRIDIYYASNNPANLEDVRFGFPGQYDFFMSATAGGLMIAVPIIAGVVRMIRKRLSVRRQEN